MQTYGTAGQFFEMMRERERRENTSQDDENQIIMKMLFNAELCPIWC